MILKLKNATTNEIKSFNLELKDEIQLAFNYLYDHEHDGIRIVEFDNDFGFEFDDNTDISEVLEVSQNMLTFNDLEMELFSEINSDRFFEPMDIVKMIQNNEYEKYNEGITEIDYGVSDFDELEDNYYFYRVDNYLYMTFTG